MLFKTCFTIAKIKAKNGHKIFKEGFKTKAINNNEIHWLRIDRDGHINSSSIATDSP